MSKEQELINKVAKSGLITIDLNKFIRQQEIVSFDIKDFLVKEMVLMEKPFREALSQMDWQSYKGKIVNVHCSNDALVPMWAYMLVTTYLEPLAEKVLFGSKDDVKQLLLQEAIDKIDVNAYREAKVVIKGCGGEISPGAYLAVTKRLKPVVHSLMFGEPCSTVPVYKKPKIAEPK